MDTDPSHSHGSCEKGGVVTIIPSVKVVIPQLVCVLPSFQCYLSGFIHEEPLYEMDFFVFVLKQFILRSRGVQSCMFWDLVKK